MKLLRAASLAIALVLLVVGTALHLDGQWGHLPTIVWLASALYGIMFVGFSLALQKGKSRGL